MRVFWESTVQASSICVRSILSLGEDDGEAQQEFLLPINRLIISNIRPGREFGMIVIWGLL